MDRRQQSGVHLPAHRRHHVVVPGLPTARRFSQSTAKNNWMLSESKLLCCFLWLLNIVIYSEIVSVLLLGMECVVIIVFLFYNV